MIGLIYARVSTPRQGEEGTSLDTQVEASLKLAQDRGIDIPSEFVLQE
jgi:DNA invertase Pin-like site-specific DNA recombinase